MARIGLSLLVFLVPWVMAHHPSYPAPIDFELLNEGEGEWVLVTTPGFVRGEAPTELICKEAFGASGPLYAAVLGVDPFCSGHAGGVGRDPRWL